MSELQHPTPQTNSPQSTAKTASTANTTAPARRVNPNQSHLGLKAFIISASVLGTVAGWGVLANQSNGLASNTPAPNTAFESVTDNGNSTIGRMSDLLVENDMQPMRSHSRWRHSAPEMYGDDRGAGSYVDERDNHRPVPPVARSQGAPSAPITRAVPTPRASAPSDNNNQADVWQPPVQQNYPAPVARSRSSR